MKTFLYRAYLYAVQIFYHKFAIKWKVDTYTLNVREAVQLHGVLSLEKFLSAEINEILSCSAQPGSSYHQCPDTIISEE